MMCRGHRLRGILRSNQERAGERAYIITSGEYMPLYAANNISKGLLRLNTPLAGVICNSREAAGEESADIVNPVCPGAEQPDGGLHSQGPIVQQCERRTVTVIEGAPDSKIAAVYRALAREIMSGGEARIPEPLSDRG